MFRFLKIFPTTTTHMYHEFFESPRYYNMMFDAWETKYGENRQEGMDLFHIFCVLQIIQHSNIFLMCDIPVVRVTN